MQIKNRLLCFAAALLLLAGCSSRELQEDIPTIAPGPTETVTPETPPASQPGINTPSDSKETRYYNDYLRMTLTLSENGSCTLRSADTDASGTYSVFPGGYTLDFGTRQETAYEGENGDLTIEGRSGWFLHDWEFWDITEEETTITATIEKEIELLSNPDGSFRLRYYAGAVACTCTAGIELAAKTADGALTLTDGQDGYVTGRNITAALDNFYDSPSDFLAEQIEDVLLADAARFYGGVSSHDTIEVSDGTVVGRLAEAELRVICADGEIVLSAILYTSAYPDGTLNYICKCCFAPAEDPTHIAALAEAVSDMTAVRLKTER